MAEDAQLLIAQAKTYFEGASDLTIRKRLWLAMMEQYGVFKYNCAGWDFNWDVMFSQPDLNQYSDSDELSFPNHAAYKQATLDHRGYEMTDRISERQKLMNRGEGRIVDLVSQKSVNLVEGFRARFSRELYIDGNATGNTGRFHGIESFMGAGTCATTDRVAVNSDTYAGLLTAQATYGGSWSTDLAAADRPNATLATDWPDGRGESEYDFWSAILCNYTASTWPSAEITWEANSIDCMRAVIGWQRKLLGDDSVPILIMLDSKMLREFKQVIQPTLRTLVPHKGSQDLGFEDVLHFEGAALKSEFDITGGVGYAITPSTMEGRFLHSRMFNTYDSPYEDFKSDSLLYKLTCYGNFRFQPKFCAKFAALGA